MTVINGEKASYCTPTFSEKRNRTLSLLLKDVEHKCTTEVGRDIHHTVLVQPFGPHLAPWNLYTDISRTVPASAVSSSDAAPGDHPQQQSQARGAGAQLHRLRTASEGGEDHHWTPPDQPAHHCLRQERCESSLLEGPNICLDGLVRKWIKIELQYM